MRTGRASSSSTPREGIFLLPRCASKNAVPSTYDAIPCVCDNPMFHNYLSKGIRRADEDGAGVFLLQRRASKNAVPSTCNAVPRVDDKMMLHSYLLKDIRRADEDRADVFLFRPDEDREGVFLLQRCASKNAAPSTCDAVPRVDDKMMPHSYLLKGIRAGHALLVRFLALQILFLMINVR
jgi:hypothetical protein